MLGDYFHTVISHIEKSDFGTSYIETAGRRESVVSSEGSVNPYTEETHKAILSIFLGARIHDAAVMIGVSDRTMRDRFLTYCKHANHDTFERIYERAVHQGYSTPPVELFQPHVLDFFPSSALSLHKRDLLPDQAKEKAEMALLRAKKELSLARIRLSVVDGMGRLLSCE
ncbi:TPA: hypothetical protein ACMDRZ_003074 [Vibrio cholerae]|uniref:hypothetical protein n=1 Tax=Vibrio TaxID=662 RepID=UPI0009CBAA98|nr:MULTISPECIES: hypothetical protein [Vibrio]OQK43751.1 hypothetical protein XM75_u0032 [Vibrio vulnificus]